MKLINALKNLASGLYRSFKRFPVTITLSTAAAVMLIAISELKLTEDTFNRIVLIIILGIPLSLCIKLFFERKDGQKAFKLFIYYVMEAAALILYYIFLLKNFDMVPVTRYIAVNLFLYLVFLYIPYLMRKEHFEMYIIKIFTNFFITVIYSVVLYLGLAAILFTIDKLLGIHIKVEIYYYTWLVVVFVFAVTYFLAGIPLKEHKFTTEGYPKLIRILLLYIVMPLLSTYTIILYVYFIKIIVTRQWPVGLVSHLVLWYSVIVAIVLFFIAPIKDINRWAGKFSSYIPKIILPILVMMFISMGIRINAYGVTENRYYVVVLGLWAAGVMLYYSLTKVKRNIFLPIALSIIALISVFGPLSSYSISKYSQNKRLEKILVKNNMIENGKIQPVKGTISKEDSNEASRVLDYFNNNHSLKEVKYLPADFKLQDMEKVFGFKYENLQPGGHEGYFYYSTKSGGAIDVRGYDYLFDTRYLNNGSSGNNLINAQYDYQSSLIKVIYDGTSVYQKDLKLFAKKIIDKYGTNNSKESILPPDEMTLLEENEKVKVKLVISNISGSIDASTGNIRDSGAEFVLLVKMK